MARNEFTHPIGQSNNILEYFSVIWLGMSVFEDYETAAVGYDNGRVADGVEGMVMMLSGLLKKPPKEVLCQIKSC